MNKRNVSIVARYQSLDSGLESLTNAWVGTDLASPAYVLSDIFGTDGTTATAHLYWSGPGASALPDHVDPYPVFVLGIYGEKNWTACRPAETDWDIFRHRCTEVSPSDIGPERCINFVMRPGDLLYMPRDSVHKAFAGEHGAAHITYSPDNPGPSSFGHKLACLAVPSKFLRKLPFFIAAPIVKWLLDYLNRRQTLRSDEDDSPCQVSENYVQTSRNGDLRYRAGSS